MRTQALVRTSRGLFEGWQGASEAERKVGYFAGATETKRHKLGGFSHGSGGQMSKIKVSGGSRSLQRL